jgi:hypothetical protein
MALDRNPYEDLPKVASFEVTSEDVSNGAALARH